MYATTIGILGVGAILVAFLMNQTGKWNREDLAYDFLNLLGAALLVWYSVLIASYPFIVLNGIWALYSLLDVWHDLERDGFLERHHKGE